MAKTSSFPATCGHCFYRFFASTNACFSESDGRTLVPCPHCGRDTDGYAETDGVFPNAFYNYKTLLDESDEEDGPRR